jgi:molecular chaperone HtpG
MPKMKSNFRGLVTLLAKNLYPEPDVFVRELIQNAHDSIQLRRAQSPEHSGRIHVSVERSNRSITFSDDGLGMTQHVIEEFLSTIGSSGTGTLTMQLKQDAHCNVATIGQFGIGLLSAFVVAERVDVYTRHFQTDEAWHWVNVGDDEYTQPATDRRPRQRASKRNLSRTQIRARRIDHRKHHPLLAGKSGLFLQAVPLASFSFQGHEPDERPVFRPNDHAVAV